MRRLNRFPGRAGAVPVRWPIRASFFLALLAACTTFDSAEPTDAGSEAGPDAAAATDALVVDAAVTEAAADAGGLACGARSCTLRTEVCCVNDAGPPTCETPGACKGTPYACTRSSDCVDFGDRGAVFCCLTLDKGKTVRAFCSTDETCEMTFHEVLCQKDDGYACPGDAACQATSAYDDQLPLLNHCAGGPKVGP